MHGRGGVVALYAASSDEALKRNVARKETFTCDEQFGESDRLCVNCSSALSGIVSKPRHSAFAILATFRHVLDHLPDSLPAVCVVRFMLRFASNCSVLARSKRVRELCVLLPVVASFILFARRPLSNTLAGELCASHIGLDFDIAGAVCDLTCILPRLSFATCASIEVGTHPIANARFLFRIRPKLVSKHRFQNGSPSMARFAPVCATFGIRESHERTIPRMKFSANSRGITLRKAETLSAFRAASTNVFVP